MQNFKNNRKPTREEHELGIYLLYVFSIVDTQIVLEKESCCLFDQSWPTIMAYFQDQQNFWLQISLLKAAIDKGLF